MKRKGGGLGAEKRKTWPVRRFPLGAEPGPNLSETTTAEARLEMMWPLALEAWSLPGRALPQYSKASMPIRKISLASDGSDGSS